MNFLNGKLLAGFPSFCVPERNEYVADDEHQNTKSIQQSLPGIVMVDNDKPYHCGNTYIHEIAKGEMIVFAKILDGHGYKFKVQKEDENAFQKFDVRLFSFGKKSQRDQIENLFD